MLSFSRVHSDTWSPCTPEKPGEELRRTDPWKIGDRVGVGWYGGHCGQCDSCQRGDFTTCVKLQVTGISYDGGYSECVCVLADTLARIPDGLRDEDAAPLMCAGITTFNALRNSGARAGDLVAIQGIGGLGHLGVQLANKFGFETIAIGRGAGTGELALRLGADNYIDAQAQDLSKELAGLGGARDFGDGARR